MLRNIKKSTQDVIETYVLLVYYGLKDSYLVDCCMLSPAEAVQIVHSVYDRYNLSNDVKMLVVVLEDDVFISNVQIYNEKQQQLQILTEVPTSIAIGLPVITNVRCGICSIEANEVVLATYRQIYQLLNYSCTAECLVKIFEVPTSDIVSSPLLAGWLLGYPCLYQSHGSSSEHSSDSSLSMMELTLCTIKGNITVHRSAVSDSKSIKKKSKTAISPTTLQRAQHRADFELLSFSVPQSILQDEAVERQVVEMTNLIVERMKGTAASMAEGTIKLAAGVGVTDIRLEVITCTVPSIVL